MLPDYQTLVNRAVLIKIYLMKMNDQERFPQTNALREDYIFIEVNMCSTYQDTEEFPLMDMELENIRMEFIPTVSQTFLSEAQSYESKGVYYKGCTLRYYQKHYSERLKDYIEMYGEDCSEEDFIIDELNGLRVNTFLLDQNLEKTIRLSLRKIKNFLKQRISTLGYNLLEKSGSNEITYECKRIAQITRENEVQESDFSEYSQRLTTPQRVILLNELGVIELIENKMKKTGGWSKNKIAAVVAEITGEKHSSIQSKLNPIGNPTVKQLNNPYNTNKSIEKVQDFLRKNNILM